MKPQSECESNYLCYSVTSHFTCKQLIYVPNIDVSPVGISNLIKR